MSHVTMTYHDGGILYGYCVDGEFEDMLELMRIGAVTNIDGWGYRARKKLIALGESFTMDQVRALYADEIAQRALPQNGAK